MNAVHKVYLGLGTNLGDRRMNLDNAVRLISQRVGRVVRESSVYETAPWGFKSDNQFLNSCICVATNLSPHSLLRVTQEIERSLGRKAKSTGGEYHDRIIDIDILLYDDIHIDEPDLKIPHPFIHEREFVLKPLMEIMEQ